MKNTNIYSINTINTNSVNKGEIIMTNKSAKKYGFKTRVVAGVLSAITVLSAAAFMTTSASAAEAGAAPAEIREGKTVIVTEIGEKEYASFSEAWMRAITMSGATVKLCSDISGVAYLNVPEGTKVNLDLNGHTIKAVNNLFTVAAGSEFAIRNGNIEEANTAVTANGNTTLDNVCITDSKDSAVKGGAGAKVVIDGCTFRNNKGKQGGAVYLPYDVEGNSIKNCDFRTNSSSEQGGAVYAACGVSDSSFYHNDAGTEGGGLYVTGNNRCFSNNAFTGNTAGTNGGGAAVTQEHNRFEKCLFHANKAKENGGALYAPEEKDIDVADCQIEYCSAGKDGGGIYSSYRSRITLDHTSILANEAKANGGAVYLGTLRSNNHAFNEVTITDNKADLGGGVYADLGAFSAADIDLSGKISIYDNDYSDVYLVQDNWKKSKLYTKPDFNAGESNVGVISSHLGCDVAVVELDQKEHEFAFHVTSKYHKLSRGFIFSDTLYMEVKD